MAQLTEESLLQAIKKDDIKAFDALMEKARCGTYRLGRFPVLSLMYLYNSRRLLAAYEEKFIKIPNYEELREPVEVSKKFSEKAGKCLRLYLSEVVTPLEMLLILDKTKRLTRIYPLTKPSLAVKERLKAIYSIRYSLSVNFEGDKIVLDKKPLSPRTKRIISVICACSVFAVGVAVGVPVTVNAFKPVEDEISDSGQTDFGSQEVAELSQMDFSSRKEYTLIRDLVLTESVDVVNCKIIGSGHKIVLQNGATLGECNGTVSGLTIESLGDAVFTTVAATAAIENVTVNVSANVGTAEGGAFVAVTNYGTIDGVTVNVSGSVNALAPQETAAGFYFGGIVQNNAVKSQNSYGVIKNCTVNYSRFSLVGEQTADASFGGVAGINNAYLQNCTVTGEIDADTFDVAGVCSVNNGMLSRNVNEADISQTSASTGWNPLAGGIVLTNNSTVEYCKNMGSISAKSTCEQPEGEDPVPTVSAAGIVCTNVGTVGACTNGGSVTAEGVGAAYAGGIAAQSYSRITTCRSNGDIFVTADKVYVGGILGFSLIYRYGYWGTVDYCICESKISATASNDEVYFVGGITGLVQQGKFTNSIDSSVIYSGGGVTNSYFLGSSATPVKYFGNIVGMCGINLYEGNSEGHNFEGNYYLNNNSSTAFGAAVVTVDEVDEFTTVEDDGATSETTEEIKNRDGYKSVLEALEK